MSGANPTSGIVQYRILGYIKYTDNAIEVSNMNDNLMTAAEIASPVRYYQDNFDVSVYVLYKLPLPISTRFAPVYGVLKAEHREPGTTATLVPHKSERNHRRNNK